MNDLSIRIHPETGQELVRGVRPMTITYKGLSATFDMPGWYATNDKEGENGLHDVKDTKASDRALNALKARANGLLEPPAIRSVRQKLRLSQKQAGALIGGGPNAFQKYEAGDVLISKAADTALRLLANDPSRLAELPAQ
ncbi:HTH-type transcriptional regulator/antitoxin MqsA [Rhizobium rosettiformans]|uniref:HTH-type transcriptional regulator/antitoxin MqsA n=1 Tax=Rhizobium rosettiformans TaxID=1368430 RepID=A0A7W8MFM6_9HYPH|nr:type II toxin-antitoxin system MqsA family antitoxin [Rhizobium rosettiformans]MBB5278635.1 HTH-type transcriptional regulator/antitoxin MqsA [Rhizobium rosettiformans]